MLIKPFSKPGNPGIRILTSTYCTRQANRKLILYDFFVTKLLNSFPGTRILQISHLLEPQSKLPVVTSDLGFNFDLTKRSFKDLALQIATRGGGGNILESLLDFKT